MIGTNFGRLIVVQTEGPEQEYELNKSSVIVGRAMTNDVILGDARVSRTHARLECGPDGCTVSDLGSANGTRLNGLRVERAALAPGDSIMLGNTTLRYERSVAEELLQMTMIDSDVDLELTIEREVLPVSINETSAPRLVVFTTQRTWEVSLDEVDELSIGRTDENDVVIEQLKVSRRHAQLTRKGDFFVLKDLGSTNGTWLNDQKVSEIVLQDGDMLHVGDAQLVFKRGFAAEALTMADESLEKMSARRPVVFVPGMMGSELWLGNERVWPNVKYLFKYPEVYAYGSDTKLEPRGIVDQVVIVPNLIKLDQYNRLGDYLVEDLGYERGKDFFEFAYDWRQDVRISSQQLAQFIESLPVNPPVTVIAHSLGTLVSRYYIERLGGKSHVERLVLMGGPHRGVPKALTSLLVAPDVLPFGIMGERLRQLVASFPTSYQILPVYSCTKDQRGKLINLFKDDSWLPEAQRPLLHAAQEFRQELGMRASVPAISIFGYGLKTIMDISLTWLDKGKFTDFEYRQESSGDNTIPQSSAVLDGTEIHPVQQHHGSLFVDHDVKMRLKMELTRQV